MPQKPKTVAAYIAAAAPPARSILRQLRKLVRLTIPAAEEKLSYGMPYYSYHGRLAYFAAFHDHCSFFVMDAGRKALSEELAPYLKSKSTMHIPIGGKVPVQLIKRVLRVQAKANAERK